MHTEHFRKGQTRRRRALTWAKGTPTQTTWLYKISVCRLCCADKANKSLRSKLLSGSAELKHLLVTSLNIACAEQCLLCREYK